MAIPDTSIEVVDLTADNDDDDGEGIEYPDWQLTYRRAFNLGKSSKKKGDSDAVESSNTRRRESASCSDSGNREAPRAGADDFRDRARLDEPDVSNDLSKANSQTPIPSVVNSDVIGIRRPPTKAPSPLENDGGAGNLQTITKELGGDVNAIRAAYEESIDSEWLADIENSTDRTIDEYQKAGRTPPSRASIQFLAMMEKSMLDSKGATSNSASRQTGATGRKANTFSAPMTPTSPANTTSYTRPTEPHSETFRKRKRSWPRPTSEAPAFIVPPNIASFEQAAPSLAKPPVAQLPPYGLLPHGHVQSPNPTIQSLPKATAPSINFSDISTPASNLSAKSAPSNQRNISPSTSQLASHQASNTNPQEISTPDVETGSEQAFSQDELSVNSEWPAMDSCPPDFDRGRFPYQRRRRGARGAPNPWVIKGHHRGPKKSLSTSKPAVDAPMPPPEATITTTGSHNTTGPSFWCFSREKSHVRPDGYITRKIRPLAESQVFNGATSKKNGPRSLLDAENADQTYQTGSALTTSTSKLNDVNRLSRKETSKFSETAILVESDVNFQNTVFRSQQDENGIHSNDLDPSKGPRGAAAISNRDGNFNTPLTSLEAWPTFPAPASQPFNEFIMDQHSSEATSGRRPSRLAAHAAASRITSQYQIPSLASLRNGTKPVEQKPKGHLSPVVLPKRLCHDCDLMISTVNFKVHLASKKHKQNASYNGGGGEQQEAEVETIQQKVRHSRLQTPAFASEVKPILPRLPAQYKIITPVMLPARRKVVRGLYNTTLAASFAAEDCQMTRPYQERKVRGRIEIIDRQNLLKQSQILQHVDFTTEEEAAIARAIVKTKDSRIDVGKTIANAYSHPDFTVAKRDKQATRLHIQDMGENIDQQAQPVFTVIESRIKDPNLRTARCLGSLLRHRELGSSVTGRHVETRSEIKTRVAEHIKPWRSFIGASHDVVSVAWAPNSVHFGAGAAAHSNPEDLQYNRPCNLLFGDLRNNTISELPDHRVDRQMPRTGPNAENEDLFNACDPKVYKTVTSIKFHPQGDQMYTASEDQTAKIWDMSRPAPSCMRSLEHDASVTGLEISHHQPGVFATASQKIQNAIRVYRMVEGQETQMGFSSARAESKPEWKMYPECLQWGSTSHTSHLLLAGFQEYEREVARESEGHLCLWDANTAQDLKLMPASQAIHTVVWHPTSIYIASGGAPGFERTDRQNTKTVVRVWDLRHPKRVHIEYECQAREMTDVTFFPLDLNIVTAGCTNSKSYVWDNRWPQQPLHELCHGDSIMPRGERDTGVMMSLWGTGSSLYYTGSSDGSIRAWDIRRHPNDVLRHTVAQLDAGIQSGAFSPDGSHLLVGDATGGIHVLSSTPWPPHPEESIGAETKIDAIPMNIIRAPDGSGAILADDTSSETQGIDAAKDLLLTGQLIVDPVYGPGKGPNYVGPYAMDVREEREGNVVGRMKKEVYKQQPFSRLGDLRPEYADPVRILAAARKEALDREYKGEIGADLMRSKALHTYQSPRVPVNEHGHPTPTSIAGMTEANQLYTFAPVQTQDTIKPGQLSDRSASTNTPTAEQAAITDEYLDQPAKYLRRGAGSGSVNSSKVRAGPMSQLSPLETSIENSIPESEMVEDPGWWPRLGEDEIRKAYARPGVRMD